MNSLHRTLTLFAVGLSTFPLAADLLEPFDREEGGWKHSSWLGWVSGNPGSPYLHGEHNWLYFHEHGPWLWMWDYQLGDWFATRPDLYPLMYDQGSGHWLAYRERIRGLRHYRDLKTSEPFAEYSGTLMPEMLQSLMGQAEGLLDDTSGIDPDTAMTEMLAWALLPIIGDPETSVCPVITRDPSEVNLFDLPSEITASADFGEGCEPEEGYGQISGRLDLQIHDLVFDMETGESIGMDLDLVATDLRRDGEPVLDGALSVGLSINSTETESESDTHWITTTDATVAASMSATGLTVGGEPVTGGMTLSGTLHSVLYEDFQTSEETETWQADLSMEMTDLSGLGMDLSTGTVRLQLDTEAGTASLETQAQTSEGAVDLELLATLSEDQTRVTLRTAEPAQLIGYTLEVNDVVYDSEVCPDSPISGVIRILFDDITYQMTFTDDCAEPYRMERL